MYIKILFFIFFAYLSMYIAAQQAKELSAFVAYSTFHLPNDTPYVEFYTTVVGNSLTFSKTNNQTYQAKFSITFQIKQQNKLIKNQVYYYSTPLLEDTTTYFTIQDVFRFKLQTGIYQGTISFNDINNPKKSVTHIEEFAIDYNNISPTISGIQLVESYKLSDNELSPFWKSGYEIQPYPINFYPKHINKLSFYFEVYNLEKDTSQSDLFILQVFISQFETKKILNNFAFFRRIQPKPLLSFINQFNIESLPSGNYLLNILIKNKNNNIIAQNQLFFQRSNPLADQLESSIKTNIVNSQFSSITNRDTLLEYIYCLRPISTENEKYFIDTRAKTADIELLQQFLASFWSSRSSNPIEAMKNYLAEVQKVNNSFSLRNIKGYETDRGRVYLQYGPPNSIVSRPNEPNAYPYEIWHYYELNNQRNRKFIFYNKSLVTNDYELLHSDAIGEPRDYQWQLKIHQRNFATNDPDLDKNDWGWGSKIEDLWQNPR